MCPTCEKKFSVQTFRQVKVKDKDIEGALQLRNLSVTRGLLAQSQLWPRFDDIIAPLDKEAETEDAKTCKG